MQWVRRLAERVGVSPAAQQQQQHPQPPRQGSSVSSQQSSTPQQQQQQQQQLPLSTSFHHRPAPQSPRCPQSLPQPQQQQQSPEAAPGRVDALAAEWAAFRAARTERDAGEHLAAAVATFNEVCASGELPAHEGGTAAFGPAQIRELCVAAAARTATELSAAATVQPSSPSPALAAALEAVANVLCGGRSAAHDEAGWVAGVAGVDTWRAGVASVVGDSKLPSAAVFALERIIAPEPATPRTARRLETDAAAEVEEGKEAAAACASEQSIEQWTVLAEVLAALCPLPATVAELQRSDALGTLFTLAACRCPAGAKQQLRDMLCDAVSQVVMLGLGTNQAAVAYFHRKGTAQHIVEAMRGFESWTPQSALLLLSCVTEWIRKSVLQAGTPVLLADFSSVNGFMLLQEALGWIEAQHSEEHDTFRVFEGVLELVFQLLAVGPELPLPDCSRDKFSNQHIVDRCRFNRTDVAPVRNKDAFLVFQMFFISSHWEKARLKVIEVMKRVYASNPLNVLLLEDLRTISAMLAKVDSLSTALKSGVVGLLVFVVTTVNCVPFKDLVALSELLAAHPRPSNETLLMVFGTAQQLVAFDPKFRLVFRETGMLTFLAQLLNELCLDAQETLEEGNERCAPKEQLNELIVGVLGCLSQVLNRTPSNIAALSEEKRLADNALSCIDNEQCRTSALAFWLQLLRQDTERTSKHLARVIDVLRAHAPSPNIPLKIDVLGTLRDFVGSGEVFKDAFRECGGFDAVVSVMAQLPGVLSSDNEAESSDGMRLLETLVALVISAMVGHQRNRQFFSEVIGFGLVSSTISTSGVLRGDHALRALHCMLDLATETPSCVEAIEALELRNPQAITSGLEILDGVSDQNVSASFLQRLCNLCNTLQSKEALCNAGAISAILRHLCASITDSSSTLQPLVLRLIEILGSHSIRASELYTLMRLIRGAGQQEALLETLHSMSALSDPAPVVDFDMSDGFACLQVTVDRPWPPPGGYTFSAWVYVESFGVHDDRQQIDLLGFQLHDQKARASFSIGPNGSLVYNAQGKPPVLFASCIEERKWFHIAVVASKTVLRSEATIFLNGAPMWNGRLPYLASSDGPAIVTIGTPQMMRRNVGCSLRWRVGPIYLLEKPITQAAVFSFFLLGRTFSDSAQISLTRYQTFDIVTSEAINLATTVVPAWNGRTGLGPLDLSNDDLDVTESQVVACLSAVHEKQTKDGRDIMLVNSASFGWTSWATLTGVCRLIAPCTMPQCLERIGGVANILPFFERATTPKQLLLAVDILRSVLQHNAPNIAEMEAIKGYQLLAMLLKDKADLITADTVDSLFALVGFRPAECPQASRVISNMQAFRHIFVYFDIWKATGKQDLQRRVLMTMTELLTMAEHSLFNAARMLSLHMVQHAQDVFSDDTISEDILALFVDLVEALLLKTMDNEDLKRVAHYTSSLIPVPPRPKQQQQSALDLTPAPLASSSSFTMLPARPTVRGLRLCNMLLRSLLRLLSSGHHSVSRLAKLLSPQWLFHFIGHSLPPETVYVALKILCVQFDLALGRHSNFVDRFNHSMGFTILRRILPSYCCDPEIYYALMCLVLGNPVKSIPEVPRFDYLDLFTTFKREELRLVVPEALPVFFDLLKRTYELPETPLSPLSRRVEASRISSPDTARLERLGDGLRMSRRFSVSGPKQAPPASRLNEAVPWLNVDRGKPEVAASSSTASIPTIQQTLVKFLMHLFVNCPDFSTAFMRNEVLSAFVAVLFPSNAVHVPSMQRGLGATTDSSVVLLFQLLVQSLEGSLRNHPRGMVHVDAALIDAVPLNASEADAITYASQVLLDLLETIESTLSKREFEEDEKVAHNISRFCTGLAGRVIQGTLVSRHGNADKLVLQFLLHVLEKIAGDATAKPVRPEVHAIYGALNQVILHLLQPGSTFAAPTATGIQQYVLGKIVNNPGIVFGPSNDPSFIRALLWFLYHMFMAEDPTVRGSATNAWKLALILRPEAAELLNTPPKGFEPLDLRTDGFDLLFQMDLNRFHLWLSEHRDIVDATFEAGVSRFAQMWLDDAVRTKEELMKQCKVRRDLKARQANTEHRRFLFRRNELSLEVLRLADQIREQETKTRIIRKRDAQDRQQFVSSLWRDLSAHLKTSRGVWTEESSETLKKWRLDATEGPFRMRRKFERDFSFYERYPAPPDDSEQPSSAVAEAKGGKRPTSLDSKAWYSEFGAQLRARQEEDARVQQLQLLQTPQLSPSQQQLLPQQQQGIRGRRMSATARTGSSPQFSGILPPSPPGEDFDLDELTSASEDDSSLEFSEEEPSGSEDAPAVAISPASAAAAGGEVSGDADVSGTASEADEADEECAKNRLRRFLEPNEGVQYMFKCETADAMDTKQGVLLIGVSNVYVVHGFTLKDGEVIDASGAAGAEGATASSSSLPSPANSEHMCLKWARDDVREVLHRRYTLRWIALELFLSDGRTHLLVFEPEDIELVRRIMRSIADATPPYTVAGLQIDLSSDTTAATAELSGTAASTSTASALRRLVRIQSDLDEMTASWVEGRVSNFQYLMYLNTVAGRSYNDLTQYPVFPWVLADYESAELDLSNPAVYRDLSKPIGALNPARAELFRKHFNDCIGVADPHHYSHHYSSAAVVVYYLLRVEPFTRPFLDLNGGHWDWPDRLFHSVLETWRMLTTGTMPQVMELTPEFFYLPEFLENRARFAFGTRQTDGRRIDGVDLPPWAHGSPREFVRRNLEALESPYVSAHLNEWIDLIFGYQQRGPAAEAALNMFNPVSYEGNVDIDAIEDEVERRSKIATIRNFGQTPQQLWDRAPHPRRNAATLVVPPPPLWSTSPGRVTALLVSKIADPVGGIMYTGGERVFPCSQRRLFVGSPQRQLIYGFPDTSVRIILNEKPHFVWYPSHGAQITAACATEDGGVIVTASTDSVVRVHTPVRGTGKKYRSRANLCGHYCVVTCLAVSRSQSIIVSGGEDGLAIVWDLNSLSFVRELSVPGTASLSEALVCIDIHSITGDVVTCSSRTIRVWSPNGDLLASQHVSGSSLPEAGAAVTACSFSREWVPGHGQVLVTGHRDGVLRVWDTERFEDPSSASAAQGTAAPGLRLKFVLPALVASPITAICIPLVDRTRLYVGNALGNLYLWLETELAKRRISR